MIVSGAVVVVVLTGDDVVVEVIAVVEVAGI